MKRLRSRTLRGRRRCQSGPRAHAYLEGVEAEFGYLQPCISTRAVGHEALVQFLEVRIALRKVVIDSVRRLVAVLQHRLRARTQLRATRSQPQECGRIDIV